MCTDPWVVHPGDEGPWPGRGVTKFVTGVTLKVRGGGLLVRGAGIERNPLQENGSPGGHRLRRRPTRGHMPGNPIARRAGLLQATQHARRMNEGRMPGSAGETLATQGRRPFPHNPQDTARQENPCRRPAPRAMSLPRKADTHTTTTRRTPPNRKTPVEAQPPGRSRCRARQKPTPPQPAGHRQTGKPL